MKVYILFIIFLFCIAKGMKSHKTLSLDFNSGSQHPILFILYFSFTSSVKRQTQKYILREIKLNRRALQSSAGPTTEIFSSCCATLCFQNQVHPLNLYFNLKRTGSSLVGEFDPRRSRQYHCSAGEVQKMIEFFIII